MAVGLNAGAEALSVILPCYCEESHFGSSLERIIAILEHTGWAYEIILVEDGSPDNTAALVREAEKQYSQVRAVFHEKNQGRGAAVVSGLKAARAPFAGFIDIDLEVDPCYIPALVMELEKGVDVATGWRHYNTSMHGLMRYVSSKVYHDISRWMLGIRLHDTETGYKFFRREAILPVAETVSARGWFWDTEIMVRAKLAGLRIVEMPVLFKRRPEKKSTVRLLPDSLDYYRNLRRLRKQLQAEGALPGLRNSPSPR